MLRVLYIRVTTLHLVVCVCFDIRFLAADWKVELRIKRRRIMEFGEQLHSNISHPVLREWQQMDLEITAKHLMYPVFIM